MEGYTDVLMAHQHGIQNCVAVLGTALGERHLQLLRRYTDRITLVLDGDAAGRRRTNEILDTLLALFEKNLVDLRILTLPEGIDPCDFIATHGSDSFRALLAQAVDALEHKFKAVTNGLDTLTDTHRASQAAEQLLVTLAQIRPVSGGASSHTLLREEQMLSRIARQFHLKEEHLRDRLVAIRKDARNRPSSRVAIEQATSEESAPAPPRSSDLPSADRDLLELFILEPTMIPRLADVIDPASIASPHARRIFAGCCRLAEQGMHEDFGRLLAAFDEPAMKNLIVELDDSAQKKANADRERWFADVVESHNRNREVAGRRATLAAARQSDADAEQLLAQFVKDSNQKHRMEYERRKK
jgi:DNA primase